MSIESGIERVAEVGRRRGILDAIAYLQDAQCAAHKAGDLRTHGAARWAVATLLAWYDSTEAQSDAAIDAVLEGVACGD